MRLTFKKGSGKEDFLSIEVPDAAQKGVAPIQHIACPKQRILPHDMIHFIVETIVPYPGFLFRLSRGDIAQFAMVPDPSFEPVERMVEVIQGMKWSGADSDWSSFRDMYEVTCAARNHDAMPIDEHHFTKILDLYAVLDTKWNATEIGESLSLSYQAPPSI